MDVSNDLAFERHGCGPQVVLLHGIGHDRHGWDPVLDLLTPHREVVLVDLPGHGESPLGTTGPLGVAELADRVDGLIAELGLGSPVVAGNSLGGAIALELARRGRARCAVAFAPIGFWSRAEIAYAVAVLRVSRALARLLRPLLPKLLRRPAFRAATLGFYFGRPRCLSAETALRTARGFADANGVTAILPYSRRYRFEGSGIDPATVTIAWGVKDRLLIGGQPRRARRLLPAAQHVLLPGAGHVPMPDVPAAVADLILNGHLRRTKPGSTEPPWARS